MYFFVRMYMRVCTHKAGKNASIRDKKTHVYCVAGMIASIHGKKTQVYRVIILKQMADHTIALVKNQNISNLRLKILRKTVTLTPVF